MSPTPVRLEIPSKNVLTRLLKTLNSRRDMKAGEWVEADHFWLDTFEWALYRQNLRLSYSARSASLFSIPDDRLIRTEPIADRPRFLRDFRKGVIRSKLAPILHVRALLQILKTHDAEKQISVLDENEKTVSRIIIRRSEVVGKNRRSRTVSQVILFPVRGYREEFQRTAEILSGTGLIPTRSNHFSAILTAAGQVPSNYVSKIAVRLKADQSAQSAAQTILASLLKTLTDNEPGILRDLDSEFLHDFRVATRRARSLLSQCKQVFPKKMAKKLRKELSFLGGMTNRPRDLDVYLLLVPVYSEAVPDSMRDDLGTFRDYLASERKKAYEKLRKVLKSKRYQDIKQLWESFLTEKLNQGAEPGNAKTPIRVLAKSTINEHAAEVFRLGGEITDSSPDEDLHQLRIECKKLRYLLEFFSSLFTEKKIKTLLRHLKVLQDNLGTFQDLHVQRTMLGTLLHEMSEVGKATRGVTLAMGFLIGHLEKEQKRIHREFYKAFESFDSPETRELIHSMFRPTGVRRS